MAENITVSNEGLAETRMAEGETVEKQEQDVSVHNLPPPVVKGSGSIYLDSSITFENYVYWAKRSREIEKTISTADAGFAHLGKIILRKKISEASASTQAQIQEQDAPVTAESNEKNPTTPAHETNNDITRDGWGITETEWEHAQRALRTATWGSIFFLITADILGPSNVPWAISKMGYGPGFALFTVFGGLSCYSGLQMWKVYIGMDSTRFPLRNYGDAAFRVYGAWARILVNLLQVFQLFLNVVLVIVNNGQGLAQMAARADGKGYICFMGAEAVLMGIGFVVAQIRTLQRLAFVTTVGIVCNIIIVIMTMAVVHQYPPNYSASMTSYGTPEGPVKTSINWPVDVTLRDKVNGMMNCIFAFGGATIFYELMAEMRRPYDFWKGFIISEIFIYACYLINGMVVYSAQGQFTFNPAYQGKSEKFTPEEASYVSNRFVTGIPNSAYRFQTLGNAINLIAAVVAGLLYANIGLKVFYSAVLHDVLHLPPLTHRTGKMVWAVIGKYNHKSLESLLPRQYPELTIL